MLIKKNGPLGLGLLACALFWAAPASAQFDRGYDRRDRYERYENLDPYERRRHDGRDDRRGRFDRDEGRGEFGRRGRDDGFGDRPRGNARPSFAGPSLEEQKRALKNHRDAQKKAIKRGYVLPQ